MTLKTVTPTYSLKAGGQNSEEYYRVVYSFADEVLRKADATVSPFVSAYKHFLATYRLEEIRASEEYVLELLSFGVLWNVYGAFALATRWAPFVLLARMAEWRKRHQRIKPVIDIARGILMTLFLFPKSGTSHPPVLPLLPEADRLAKWLDATGEFREQALRFIRWRAYWDTLPIEDLLSVRDGIFALADWFTTRSEDVLGAYTANVDHFRHDNAARYRWREDRVSCMRSRVEYHLNMVGAEILNRAFRADYDAAEAKVVLVPGCMRKRPDEECEAVRELRGMRCTGCETDCHVNRLRAMGLRRAFPVYVIPHASDLSLWSPTYSGVRCGVVASACVTTLVEGGWELKRYDVPAQCVLLDASGCHRHWGCTGVHTDFSLREFKRVL
ncbi:MAG TPA: DUF116 domain-containing protein [Bacteroidota bacterium]|nr:DUF116 domain-containing protein [Bacteroidota bacterium]